MGTTLKRIAEDIISWADDHPRPMPWKKTRDPYKIWISEIILQQTQVVQGIPYYNKFISRFPTLRDLAQASEDQVLKAWQGLGYNSRARNLHHAARTIATDYHGVFPKTYADIVALKGIGPYTAAAIASFAFGQPTPVLDSNVIRVLCRISGLTGLSTDKGTCEEMYRQLNIMISGQDPAVFNQAMMNFGAGVCTARNPDCESCPVADHCVALRDGLVSLLPVKPEKRPRKARFLHYFLISDQKRLFIRKRTLTDIWPGMYELPGLESGSWRKPAGSAGLLKGLGIDPNLPVESDVRLAQTLTHQEISCRFYRIPLSGAPRRREINGSRFELFENLEKFAFPKIIRTYLNKQSIQI